MPIAPAFPAHVVSPAPPPPDPPVVGYPSTPKVLCPEPPAPPPSAVILINEVFDPPTGKGRELALPVCIPPAPPAPTIIL